MIPVNELRIGNWVYPISFDSKSIYTLTHKPLQITAESFSLMKKWGEKIYDPIPLTHDLLFSLGFNCRSTDASNLERLFRLELWVDYELILIETPGFNKFEMGTITKKGNLLYGEEIKGVHQLQNLYFALTSKELKIDF